MSGKSAYVSLHYTIYSANSLLWANVPVVVGFFFFLGEALIAFLPRPTSFLSLFFLPFKVEELFLCKVTLFLAKADALAAEKRVRVYVPRRYPRCVGHAVTHTSIGRH